MFAAEKQARVLSTSVRGLEMPVDKCPSCARGACPFLCPWSALCFCLLHMYNKSVLLYSTVRRYKKSRPRTTKFHLMYRILLYVGFAEIDQRNLMFRGASQKCSDGEMSVSHSVTSQTQKTLACLF